MIDDVCGLLLPFKRMEADSDCKIKKLGSDEDNEETVGPFLRYMNDGYEWPDLYAELDEMLEACILVYGLAELRRMAREGKTFKAESASNILTLPLTHGEVMNVIETNKDVLQNSKFVSNEFFTDIIHAAHERNMVACPLPASACHLSPTSIIACDDEFQKEELVYTVHVNHRRKQIVVCFRGSVTRNDWMTNIEVYMKEVPNPVASHSTQEKTVCIHNGFFDYMFGPSKMSKHNSEYDEIMEDFVKPVIKKHPTYKLYVTGHSLGGALATMFAFQVASAPDSVIPKPVSLVSIASPYVGDSSFRAAHQLLESLGKLRHIRLSNHKDFVPLIPQFSFRWKFYDQSSHVGALFKHVGVNLRLFDGKAPPEIKYPRIRTGFFTNTWDEFTRSWDQSVFTNLSWNPLDYVTMRPHSLREYSRRLHKDKNCLEQLELNDLYADKELVGNLVPQF